MNKMKMSWEKQQAEHIVGALHCTFQMERVKHGINGLAASKQLPRFEGHSFARLGRVVFLARLREKM